LMFRKLLRLENRVLQVEQSLKEAIWKIEAFEGVQKEMMWKLQLQAEESAEEMDVEDSKRLVALAQASKHYSAAATPLTERKKGKHEQ